MCRVLRAIAIASALVTTNALAQVDGVDLNGRWRCLKSCPGRLGGYAFITQNGWDLNMVNDAGQASRAWVEHPGRIWIQQANQGAIYSPTGLTIQFDRGTIWRRAR